MDTAQAKCLVSRFSQHAALVRRVHITIVIIDQCAKADSSWVSQVHVTSLKYSQNLAEDDAGIALRKDKSILVEIDNVIESLKIEI